MRVHCENRVNKFSLLVERLADFISTAFVATQTSLDHVELKQILLLKFRFADAKKKMPKSIYASLWNSDRSEQRRRSCIVQFDESFEWFFSILLRRIKFQQFSQEFQMNNHLIILFSISKIISLLVSWSNALTRFFFCCRHFYCVNCHISVGIFPKRTPEWEKKNVRLTHFRLWERIAGFSSHFKSFIDVANVWARSEHLTHEINRNEIRCLCVFNLVHDCVLLYE